MQFSSLAWWHLLKRGANLKIFGNGNEVFNNTVSCISNNAVKMQIGKQILSNAGRIFSSCIKLLNLHRFQRLVALKVELPLLNIARNNEYE